MALLPESLYTISQTRELDQLAIDAGTPAYTLMARAAQALLGLIQEKYPGTQRLLIACGGGNNAGDGYVLARLALAQGMQVDVYSAVDTAELQQEAKQAHDDWKSTENHCAVSLSAFDLPQQGEPAYDVIVDALLGSGLSRPIEGNIAEAVLAINNYPAKVIAADVPTGVNANTGAVNSLAVNANMTLCFVGLKQGLFGGIAPDYCGEVYFNDLGTESSSHSVTPSGMRISQSWVNQYLAPRDRSTHKGQCGHVLVIGGNRGMSGAALIAGQAALRTGAGLVSIATRPAHANVLNIHQPELMVHGISELENLQELIDKASVIALGPGLGDDFWAKEMFKTAVNADKPVVVDADGLGLLAQEFIEREHWVLTPHPGEAAQLNGTSAHAVQENRFQTAQSLAEHYQAVVVLKGAGSVIAQPSEPYLLNNTGNPGMASGGMGDCLTGIIAALIAQGLALDEAAACGTFLHGMAADRVAKAYGERGMVATDLLEPLRKLLNP